MIVRMVSFPYKIERGGLICLRIVFDNMPFFDVRAQLHLCYYRFRELGRFFFVY